jgi:hypothetical protein
MSTSIHDIEAGDYVETLDHRLLKIQSVYGVWPVMAKPSEGGCGVLTESGENISMWDAHSYHTAIEVEGNSWVSYL